MTLDRSTPLSPHPAITPSRRGQSTRMLLVGVCAWISCCLLIAGWLPEVNNNMGTMWLISGLMGLVSAVGLAETIKLDMRSQESLLHQYVQAALTDSLTGLANRHALDEAVQKSLEHATRTRRPLCLIMLDIDHFKGFNDQWGHQAGDAVLRCVSKKMQDQFTDQGLVARFGGEEFAILLPDCHLADAERQAELCRQLVKSTECLYRDRSFRISISLGVTDSQPGESSEQFIQRADMALYAAKKLGRDCVWVADPKREGAHEEPVRVEGVPVPVLAKTSPRPVELRQA